MSKFVEKLQLLYREYNQTIIKINEIMNVEKLTVNSTEIKKLVYKQQPIALFDKIRLGVAYYTFNIVLEDAYEGRVGFGCEIPVVDMGGADFGKEMEAKLLLRWLNTDVLYFIPIQK